MAAQLKHRGPDDDGTWADAASGIGLGFRRLAILDVSELGHQPMRSFSGRFTLVFNGEIYNYVELREELKRLGARFKGGSDTEVVLAAFEAWGIESSLRRFVGMFAMAIWDRSLPRLTLVRDRLGIKPLYYGPHGNTLLFGSELKALRVDDDFDATLDWRAIATYLRYLYVPAPLSVYQRVRKVPPGHFVHIDGGSGIHRAAPMAYWTLGETAQRGLASRSGLTEKRERAVDELESILLDAVRIRLRSDVPLGVLLSGGVDSSLVAALAQCQLDRPVRTFTIGFDDPVHDEARHARGVAHHLGTDHEELMVRGDDVLELLPDTTCIFDEPLADPSQLPTLLVSRLARQHVTVALAGDGGDELFGGYNRYVFGPLWHARFGRLPRRARLRLGRFLQNTRPDRVEAFFRTLSGRGGTAFPRLAGEKVHKLGRVATASSDLEVHRVLTGVGWPDPRVLGEALDPTPDAIEEAYCSAPEVGEMERMMFADQVSYLPDDLLAKVDRTSMSCSLEVRVPLLDHRVVEHSWKLTTDLKVQGGQGKIALKEILFRHVPRGLVERPKVGFTPPLASWLAGPLGGWAEDLLARDRVARCGILDADAVQNEWKSFKDGRKEKALGVWALLQLQSWSEHHV